MRAVDTYVLVRLISRNDAAQVAAAEAFVAPGAWTSHLTLAEALEQANVYELVVNLKTARRLGIKLPQTFLFQATQTIE